MAPLRAVAAAWALLTILPLPAPLRRQLVPADWARCAGAFPIVGLFVGLVLAAIGHVAVDLVGAFAGAAVVVVSSAILTAGLHLDGLADSADALGARGTGEGQRQQRLQIMRDHATGAYGTLALGSALLLQASTLASLALAGGQVLITALVLAVPLARTAGVLHAAALPSARPIGLGASFTVQRAGLAVAAAGTAVLVGGIGVLRVIDHRSLEGAQAVAGAVIAAFIATSVTTALARTKLGGRTGDTIGATIVVAETAALLGFLALR